MLNCIFIFGVLMSVLRPKYELDHAEVQGAVTTIPAEEYTRLTGRVYPYPRVGIRAPDGMFPQYIAGDGRPLGPKYTTDSMASPPSSGTVRARALRQTALMPKYMAGDGNSMGPHYLLDGAEVQGVMPAETYYRLTGKLTSRPELPPHYQVAQAPFVRAPALVFDWGTFFWGAVGGGVVTLAMVYGIIPALAEWGAAEVRKKYR